MLWCYFGGNKREISDAAQNEFKEETTLKSLIFYCISDVNQLQSIHNPRLCHPEEGPSSDVMMDFI